MSEITPPSPPPPPSTPSAPQPTAAVSNPPEALLKELSLGARLDAVIAGTTAKGLVEIETSFGRIALQTNFPLPPQGPLQLQLTAKGPQLLFLITAIHGLQPQAALRSLGLLATPSAKAAAPAGNAGAAPGTGAAVTFPAAPGAPQGAATAGPAPVNLAPGATMTLTLLRGGPAPTGAVTGQTPGATPGAAQTAQAGQPIQAATGSQPAHPGKAGQAGAQGGSLASTGGAPQTAPPFPPGTLFSVRVTAFQPASAEAGATPPPSPPASGNLVPGATISGVVIGRASPSGHPIVQTHGGSVTVATQTPVATGSTVTFEVLSQTQPTAGTGVHPAAHTSPLAALLGGSWPALEEAVVALEGLNPAAAQQLVNAVLPRPGLTLGGNVLFFLAALTGGDLRGWIGDGPAKILLKTRPQLFNRLRDDFTTLRTIADEPRAGDWRTILIPFHNGNEIEQIRLFKRRAGEHPDDEEEGRKGTRFVIEVNLTRIGRFQLDGLVYEKEKSLDLIVRTETKLPKKMQDDIRDIFENANTVTGLKGGLVFQAAPPNFVKVEGLEPEPENLGLIV